MPYTMKLNEKFVIENNNNPEWSLECRRTVRSPYIAMVRKGSVSYDIFFENASFHSLSSAILFRNIGSNESILSTIGIYAKLAAVTSVAISNTFSAKRFFVVCNDLNIFDSNGSF